MTPLLIKGSKKNTFVDAFASTCITSLQKDKLETVNDKEKIMMLGGQRWKADSSSYVLGRHYDSDLCKYVTYSKQKILIFK